MNKPLNALLTQIGGFHKEIAKKSGMTTQKLNKRLESEKCDVELLIHIMKCNGVTKFQYERMKIEVVL